MRSARRAAAAAPSGYSGTPLAKKLGIRAGCRLCLRDAPANYACLPSELTEDTVRELALPLGMVDVKVCAVDATWSGLKLVVRKAARADWPRRVPERSP
jgi:hypothetical protein